MRRAVSFAALLWLVGCAADPIGHQKGELYCSMEESRAGTCSILSPVRGGGRDRFGIH